MEMTKIQLSFHVHLSPLKVHLKMVCDLMKLQTPPREGGGVACKFSGDSDNF